MAVTPQIPKCHHNLGSASVVVTFGSLWCHSHDLKLGINSFNKAPTVPITVGGLIANGATINATPDSGAERSACGVEILHQLGIDTANLRDPSHVLRAADNHPITQLGEFDAQLTCGNFTVDETIHVVQGTTGMYLSWYTAQALSFLPVNYPCQQVAQSPLVVINPVPILTT